MELVGPECIQEQNTKVKLALKRDVMRGWSGLPNKGGASWFVLLPKYYWHYRLYEEKMGEACDTHGVRGMHARIWWGKLKTRGDLKDLI
jgi:hypothetical protein